jgi:hypothetical protein
MTAKRASAEILETNKTKDGQLEVVLTSADGHEAKLCFSADAAASLASILSEFAAASAARSSAVPTKRPDSFAVGSGRFERVVLLRFEDDAPYALKPEVAMELCEALLEQSETVAAQPEQVLQ